MELVYQNLQNSAVFSTSPSFLLMSKLVQQWSHKTKLLPKRVNYAHEQLPTKV
jgi:hypothetical protein